MLLLAALILQRSRYGRTFSDGDSDNLAKSENESVLTSDSKALLQISA
jgi:hypothetical protein